MERIILENIMCVFGSFYCSFSQINDSVVKPNPGNSDKHKLHVWTELTTSDHFYADVATAWTCSDISKLMVHVKLLQQPNKRVIV